LLPFEAEADWDRFADDPIEVVFAYLQCFDDDATQSREVPRHVLEAMAAIFRSFVNGECATLEKAFAVTGRTQIEEHRLSIQDAEDIWAFWDERDSRSARGKTSRGAKSFEQAIEDAADRQGMKAEALREVYKRNGPRRH